MLSAVPCRIRAGLPLARTASTSPRKSSIHEETTAWAATGALATAVFQLAVTASRLIRRPQLLDRRWPDLDTDAAGPRLHKAAHYARRALGDPRAVVLTGDVVTLLPDATVTVDVPGFEQEAALALASADPAAAAGVLDRHGGDLLPGDPYAEWAAGPRDHLDRLRDRLLRLAGRWEEVLRRDPLDEDAHVGLAGSLARQGELRAALDQLAVLEQTLGRELGTRPGPAALALKEELARTLEQRGGLGAADHGQLEQRIGFCRTLDGVTVAYATSGEGPPLVKAANWLTHLHHDWTSPVWRHWLVALSRRHTLVRYDERGCGLSDWDIPAPSLEAWVSDLEAVVEAAGLDRFPLLGISQGAPVAIRYAARHPGRVTRLVLYGGYAQGRLHRQETVERVRRHELDLELVRLGWGSDTDAFRQTFTSQFMPDASREVWEAFNRLQRQTSSPENAARVLEVNADTDVTEEAGRISCPTLVLHSRDDQRPPFSQGRLLASLIPGSRFVALESRNHILQPDEPAWARFVLEVEAFLAGDS